MRRIQAFQISRRNFFFKRKFAHKAGEKRKYYLPEDLADKVAQVGELNTRTGYLKVNPGIRKLLFQQKVWKRTPEES